MAAQSISFFFRHVLKLPYVIPSLIYPTGSSKLPPVMSAEEIKTLIDSISNIKHRTVVMLLYSTGMRLSEIAHLKIADIDSKNMRIKVVQGSCCKNKTLQLVQVYNPWKRGSGNKTIGCNGV
jgi:integrase/recombinase XerD